MTQNSQMRAWMVWDPDDITAVIVFAQTRGKARRAGVGELELSGCTADFLSVHVRRAPEFDQYAAQGKVPVKVLLDDGWMLPCVDCGMATGLSENAVVIDGEVYCEECAVEALETLEGGEKV